MRDAGDARNRILLVYFGFVEAGDLAQHGWPLVTLSVTNRACPCWWWRWTCIAGFAPMLTLMSGAAIDLN